METNKLYPLGEFDPDKSHKDNTVNPYSSDINVEFIQKSIAHKNRKCSDILNKLGVELVHFEQFDNNTKMFTFEIHNLNEIAWGTSKDNEYYIHVTISYDLDEGIEVAKCDDNIKCYYRNPYNKRIIPLNKLLTEEQTKLFKSNMEYPFNVEINLKSGLNFILNKGTEDDIEKLTGFMNNIVDDLY